MAVYDGIAKRYFSDAKPAPQVGEVTREQMVAAVRPLCNTDAVAEKLVDVSMDEYRAILALRPQAVPMTDEVRRSYQYLLAMNTPHGFGDRIGPFVKWLQDSGITTKAEDAHQPTKEAEKP